MERVQEQAEQGIINENQDFPKVLVVKEEEEIEEKEENENLGDSPVFQCGICGCVEENSEELVLHYRCHEESNDTDVSERVQEILTQENISRQDVIKEPIATLEVPEVEAPENTKLYFTKIRSWKQWRQLYKYYSDIFGESRINNNGTMYVAERQVAYINFYNRRDMLGALQEKRYRPREAFQHPSVPKYPAFAVGFENWKIDVIKPVALQLLKASELALKEQKEQPGICEGWGVVSYKTKSELNWALKKKKFSLRCKNRVAVVALQPYRARKASHIPLCQTSSTLP
jgi:hypothetical protein